MGLKRSFLTDKLMKINKCKSNNPLPEFKKRTEIFKTTRYKTYTKRRHSALLKSEDNEVPLNQCFNNRITLKRGIFPYAIRTNILKKKQKVHKTPNRKNPTLQIPTCPSSSNNSFSDLGLRCKEKLTPVSMFPENKSNGSSTPGTDMDELIDWQPPLVKRSKNDKKVSSDNRGEGIPDLYDFKFYTPVEAQQHVMYLQYCELMKKRAIYERCLNFESFPDIIPEIQRKLWGLRLKRDTETSCSQQNTTSHADFLTYISVDDNVSEDKEESTQQRLEINERNDNPKNASLTQVLDNRVKFKFPMKSWILTHDQNPRTINTQSKNQKSIKENVVIRTKKSMANLENENQSDFFFMGKRNLYPNFPKVSFKTWNTDNQFVLRPNVIPDTIDNNLTSRPLEYLKNVSENIENVRLADKSKCADTIEQNIGVPPLEFLENLERNAETNYHKVKIDGNVKKNRIPENYFDQSKKKFNYKPFLPNANKVNSFNSPETQAFNQFQRKGVLKNCDKNRIIETPIPEKGFKIFPSANKYSFASRNEPDISNEDDFSLFNTVLAERDRHAEISQFLF